MFVLGIAFLLYSVLLANAVKQPHLTSFDKETLKIVFNTGFSKGFHDVQSVFLAVKGNALLEGKFDHEREACKLFQSTFLSSEKVSDLYAAANGVFLLKSENCVLDTSKAKNVLLAIDRITSLENLFLTVKTLHSLKIEIDSDAVKKAMDNFLKKDSSALSQAYSYYIASQLMKSKAELKKYFLEIEDTIQQADEADNVYMYYDDGIFTTAFILNGIFELSAKYEEVPPIGMDKLMKFSNFLLSRRYTYQLRAAVELTAAIKTLSRNEHVVPLVASLSDDGIVHRNGQPIVTIAITNLWGDLISDAHIVADTVKNVQSAVTIMTKKTMVPSAVGGLYELDLSGTAQDRLVRGFYAIRLDVRMNETRYNGGVSGPVLVAKMVADVVVDNAELSIKERDQLTGVANYRLTMGALLQDKLAMNWHQRLDMRFSIRDTATGDGDATKGQLLRAHQVFIKMTHASTQQEIIFVVEPDKDNLYKFSLDLEKVNKEFDNLSGDYRMELLIGDASLTTPDNWIFANIKLDMPSNPSTDTTSDNRRSVAGSKRAVANPRVGKGPSVAKPQIFHMFKPAEKRGGQLISTIFTILCIVPPFAIMLLLWAVLGINVANFQLSLSPLMFHVGLIAIFGLYYCYWSYLNMFTTLSYMIPLGGVTAFFGNRLLRQIAAKRKEA